INSREQNQRRHSTTKGHFRPVFIQSAAVLKAVKARAWKRRSAPSMAERRPALTASARVGIGNLWSGREKASTAVEPKKGFKRESKSERKKVLAFVAAMRKGRSGRQARTKEQRKARRLSTT